MLLLKYLFLCYYNHFNAMETVVHNKVYFSSQWFNFTQVFHMEQPVFHYIMATIKQFIQFNPLSPGIVHKKPIFLPTSRLQGLREFSHTQMDRIYPY